MYPCTQTISVPRRSFGLLPRLLALTILFAAELLIISVWLDNASLTSRGGLVGLVGQWGAWTVRGIVGFVAIFLTFAYLKSNAALVRISDQVERAPIGRALLAAHLFAMAAFGALSWALYGNHMAAFFADLSVPVWLAAGGSGIAFAAFSFIPLTLWMRLVRETGSLWAYALAAVVSACIVGSYSQSLWMPSAHLTFDVVRVFLSPFVAGIIADPVTRHLGTAKFSVEIAWGCSGFEGAGLILAFGVMWLWLFRRECRFPQALLLIPAGVVAIFFLNAVRITALILMGNAGAPQIALGGFHSQAGWIAFNAVALGLSFAARRIPWLTNREKPAPRTGEKYSDNATAAYLLPFLSILAVGMVTAAASGDFEWLYPMRFLAAAGALWLLRKSYADLDWKFGWFGPAIGVLVFAMWIAMDALLKTTTSDAMPHALADSSTPIRVTWIVFRALAGIVTVPIAEELAFRGFLLRRLISPHFEALPLRTFTWLGLAISSVAFGALHGNLWFSGILAGLLYAWALLRRGRIGEAVVAHATTNALLVGYVLIFQKWHLW
jgi:exosortase E/protease (VPEID-CTERM system)